LKDSDPSFWMLTFVLRQSESENRELRDSLNICKDVIIRMHANHRRRANLER